MTAFKSFRRTRNFILIAHQLDFYRTPQITKVYERKKEWRCRKSNRKEKNGQKSGVFEGGITNCCAGKELGT